MSDLSERLVQAADRAIAKAECDPHGDYSDLAAPAVVAVICALLHHDEAHLGLFPVDLEVLADEIEEAGTYEQ